MTETPFPKGIKSVEACGRSLRYWSGRDAKGPLMRLSWPLDPLLLPKIRFVRTGDAIRPRLHVRRCPRRTRSGACPVHPFRAKHEDATHYNRWRISQESAEGALR